MPRIECCIHFAHFLRGLLFNRAFARVSVCEQRSALCRTVEMVAHSTLSTLRSIDTIRFVWCAVCSSHHSYRRSCFGRYCCSISYQYRRIASIPSRERSRMCCAAVMATPQMHRNSCRLIDGAQTIGSRNSTKFDSAVWPLYRSEWKTGRQCVPYCQKCHGNGNECN